MPSTSLRRTLLVFGAFLAAAVAGPAEASPVLDQQSTKGTGTNNFGTQRFAQTFTVGVEGVLDGVDLSFYLFDGDGELTVTVTRLRDDGRPDEGEVLGATTVSGSDHPDHTEHPAKQMYVDLSESGIGAAVGDQLALVLEGTGGVLTWSASPAYAGGTEWRTWNTSNGSSCPDWCSNSDQGVYFRTWMDPNEQPVAGAGPVPEGFVGHRVSLDGSASFDDDGDPLTYHWTLLDSPEGSSAVLEDAGSATPEFVPDVEGTYVVELVVNDGTFDSEPDLLEVEVTIPDYEWLARVTELPAGDPLCPDGGVVLELGHDDGSGDATAFDGVLDDDEVTESHVVCHGEDGEDGTSCTVTDNGDGTATIACEDGTTYTVEDGEDGEDGQNGQDGEDGQDGLDGQDGVPCTVVEEDDGATLVCPDGTTYALAGQGCAGCAQAPVGSSGPAAVLGLLLFGWARRRSPPAVRG